MNLEELKKIHEDNKREYQKSIAEYRKIYKKYYPEEYGVLKGLVESGELKPLSEKERHTGESLLNRVDDNYKERVPNFYEPINLHVDDPDLQDKFNYYHWGTIGGRVIPNLDLTECEVEFLRKFQSLLDVLHSLSFLDNNLKSYTYSSFHDAEEVFADIDYYLDTKTVSYSHEDIIITDPCYVMIDKENDPKHEHEDDWTLSHYGYVLERLGHFTTDKYITSDTLYGDWSCTTYNTDTKEVIGEFCADAGLVSVLSLKQVLSYNPDYDDYIKSLWTTTLIKGFTGEVTIKVGYTPENHDFYRYVEGKGSVNFIGTQTGL